MNEQSICEAIQNQLLLRFWYTGDTQPGYRRVEPHMLALNRKDSLALSAWFIEGVSTSGNQGWKEYLVEQMAEITVLPTPFSGARPGYQPSGGKTFHSVRCCL